MDVIGGEESDLQVLRRLGVRGTRQHAQQEGEHSSEDHRAAPFE